MAKRKSYSYAEFISTNVAMRCFSLMIDSAFANVEKNDVIELPPESFREVKDENLLPPPSEQEYK